MGTSVAGAQTPPPTPTIKKPIKQTPASAANLSPVTHMEAATFLKRVENALASVLKVKATASGLSASGTVATREQLIAELSRIVAYTKPAFSMTPVPNTKPMRVLNVVGDKAKQQATDLARLGFVPTTCPLFTNKADNLTPVQFGDTVGYFVARMAELTHTPSSRFTPYLQDPAG